jgi:hypothetical protein
MAPRFFEPPDGHYFLFGQPLTLRVKPGLPYPLLTVHFRTPRPEVNGPGRLLADVSY